jgi:hypothetical protein
MDEENVLIGGGFGSNKVVGLGESCAEKAVVQPAVFL